MGTHIDEIDQVIAEGHEQMERSDLIHSALTLLNQPKTRDFKILAGSLYEKGMTAQQLANRLKVTLGNRL